MSYDVNIGGEWSNYTYNLGPFFREYLGGEGLNGLDGMTGREASETILRAIDRVHHDYVRAEPGALQRKFDAPNGWGSTFGALLFLAKLMASCRDNPRSKVRVS